VTATVPCLLPPCGCCWQQGQCQTHGRQTAAVH
jgi:hypothetical protein